MNRCQRRSVILSNDPSITAWGWVVIDVEDQVCLEAGCIKTQPNHKKLRIRKGDDTVRRISEINSELLSLFKKYEVKYILSELPHGSQSAVSAVMLGIVTGIMQTISDAKNIGIEWYSEADSKLCILGKRSATKDEMIAAIDKVYSMPWTNVGYKDEAMADAMAVYHVAYKQSDVIKFLIK
jgi:Holliday junction resolvasome RuvABC endonuclease subunit